MAGTGKSRPRGLSPEVRAAQNRATTRAGRTAALVLVGTGLFWIVAIWAGDALGLDNRTRALFDLIALAGFGAGLYLTYRTHKLRQSER